MAHDHVGPDVCPLLQGVQHRMAATREVLERPASDVVGMRCSTVAPIEYSLYVPGISGCLFG
jgi:hypothetical protein